MSAYSAKGGQADTRLRDLRSIGLGDFADLIAAAEMQPAPKEPDESTRPGAQIASCTLSEEERSRFEAQFQDQLAPLKAAATASGDENDKSISFADAFQIAEKSVETGAGRTVNVDRAATVGGAEQAATNRFASALASRPAVSTGRPADAAPRLRPIARSDFDLGDFYERIGLAGAEAQALTRILSHDVAAHGAIDDLATERRRVEELMAAFANLPETVFDNRAEQGGAQENGSEGSPKEGAPEQGELSQSPDALEPEHPPRRTAVPEDIPIAGAVPIGAF